MLGSLKSRLALWILLPTILLASIDLSIIYRDSENVATSVQQRILYGSAKIIAEQLSFNNGSYDISIPPAPSFVSSIPIIIPRPRISAMTEG